MNTKKLALALFPLLLAFASCMNMNGSSGKEGAIRVTLPESGSRGATQLSKSNPLYEVSLMQGDKTLKTLSSESTGGGDFVFDELEPGTYKIVVTARQQDGTFLARNSAEVEVTAGETQNCPITLILAGNKGKVFNSDYYVLTDYRGYTDFVNSVDSTTSMSSTQARLGAEDINGTQFSVRKSSSFEVYIFKNENSAATVAISQSGIAAIDDYIYYDTINDSLWVGAYSSSGFYFANNINKLFYEDGSQPGSITLNTPCTLSGLSIYPNAQYTAFAASGTELYIAYTNGGTSYLQRAKIEGENDSFTITAIGNPQSTQDMGVDGQITDIVIHYDDYVYALVSDRKKLNGSAINNGDTVKSRGALLKIAGTDSGFEAEDILGWTNSARAIKSKKLNDENNPYNGVSEQIDSINAYIPALSESSKKFYGAERFVAIKPKELAIADCGANIILPDYKNKKNGNMFQHDRVVTVNLYDFAISNVTELNNLDFKSLSISGVISYITDFTPSYSSDEE